MQRADGIGGAVIETWYHVFLALPSHVLALNTFSLGHVVTTTADQTVWFPTTCSLRMQSCTSSSETLISALLVYPVRWLCPPQNFWCWSVKFGVLECTCVAMFGGAWDGVSQYSNPRPKVQREISEALHKAKQVAI